MGTAMEVSAVITCLVVVAQIYCVLCEPLAVHDLAVDGVPKNHERQRRSHEIESPKDKVNDGKENKTIAPIGSKLQKTKIVPKEEKKEKLSIKEKNKPKDVKKIKNLLEEIATIARNRSEAKDIHKIRHLVDEIDNLNKAKASAKSNKKVPKKESITNKKVSKEKVSKILSEECKIVSNKSKEVKSKSLEITADKITERRRLNKDISLLTDQNTRKEIKDENLIEIEEHKYEEELLRCPYKYAPNTDNLSMGQNYYAGYNVAPYAYTGQGNKAGNDLTTCNNYPQATYGKYEYGNSGYYYNQPMYQKSSEYTRLTRVSPYRNTLLGAKGCSKPFVRSIKGDQRDLSRMQGPDFYLNGNYIENVASNNNYALATDCGHGSGQNGYFNAISADPANQPYCQDYTRFRKTWLDANSIIKAKTPDEQIVKSINEDRKELTTVQSPEFCRKYYTLSQKQYSGNNEVLNQYRYSIDPYQCSK